MLEINDNAYATLLDYSANTYLEKKVNLFHERYPKRYECAGHNNVRLFVSEAIEKAKTYNMLADREVDGLMTLMHFLGIDFDHDPQYPWARFHRFADKKNTERQEPRVLYSSTKCI